MIIINKFGGEIVGTPRLVKLALKRIKEQLNKKEKPIVVVSALAGVTDKLKKLAQLDFKKDKEKIEFFLKKLKKIHLDWMEKLEIENSHLKEKLENLNERLKNDLKKKKTNKLAFEDRILSFGEKWSALLFAQFLNKNGILAKSFFSDELGIITDENFGNANILPKESSKNVKLKLKNFSEIPVITGFIGKTKKGQTTTFGRGGSDTTACFLGYVFKNAKVILWKNVAGVLSADPKIVKNPKEIKFLTYKEAKEAGKIIQGKAINWIEKLKKEIEIAFIVNPKKKTIIKSNLSLEFGIKILNFKENLKLFIISGEKITKPGALHEISETISKKGINMVLIRNTKETLYIVIEKDNYDLENCQKKISSLGYKITTKDIGMISAIGKMDWKIVEKFNRYLYQISPKAEMGAFPYQNCVRLEAILAPNEKNKVLSFLHQKLI